MARVLIVGCGYTGSRVARLVAGSGHEVIATSRDAAKLAGLPVTPLRFEIGNDLGIGVDEQSLVLLSTPVVDSALAATVARAKRVVFLSTTGVYGTQQEVNETSRPGPGTERQHARLRSEEFLEKTAIILRPAAIYGPHRGVHTAIRSGTYRMSGDGSNHVSRIHVDDLAAHVVAALFSDVAGPWPVADDHPCTSREIAEFCADLLLLPLPPSVPPEELGETRQTNRRVDGSAVRRLLGIQLKYPSYRSGIPACVASEADARAF